MTPSNRAMRHVGRWRPSRPVQAFPADHRPCSGIPSTRFWGVGGDHLRKQLQNALELRALTDPQAIARLIRHGRA